MARRLVALASEAGADAVKFSLSSAAAPRPFDLKSWRAVRADAGRTTALVLAPTDIDAFAVARQVKPDIYQVDPGVLGDIELVSRIGRERRPVLLVAAGCTTATIGAAVRALASCPLVILHAVLVKGLPPGRARLQYVQWLAKRFKRPAGYLGHEPGVGWALVAAAMGAVVIEKSFTIDKSLAGADHSTSLDPRELRSLVTGVRQLREALGPVGERRVFGEELPALEEHDRSLVARRPLRRGERLRPVDVATQRMSGGLSPRMGGWLTGRRLLYDIEAGEPITFGVVEIE